MINNFNIVICDHIHKSGLDILRNTDNIKLIDATNIPKDKLIKEIIPLADIAITRSSTDVNSKFLEMAKKMKAIIRAGVGVDNINIKEASKQGIVVMNIPTANTIAAVELTMTHILSCVREFPYAHNNLKIDRVWRREDWYGTELKGKKLGIIGFGNIGSRVAKRAKAFEMDVITYDPYIDSSKAIDLGIDYINNFEDIFTCDIITIHTPKNHETIGMIGQEEISKMKDGVILINCARGGLYNEKALLEGLTSGKIRMAGIDVFDKEPATDNLLLDLKNITVTPHLGANTKESQRNISIQAAKNAILAVKGISYPNALNLPVLEKSLSKYIINFFELSQKISYIAAQATSENIKSIKIIAEGNISKHIDILEIFSIVGALTPSIENSVNYVNAKLIAMEKDINIIKETSISTSIFQNKISIQLTTKSKIFSISATIFNENIQRIIEINNYHLEIIPQGEMIFFTGLDTSGVIADIGNIFKKNNLNINDFRLGRIKEKALSVISTNTKIPKIVLNDLRNLDTCFDLQYISI